MSALSQGHEPQGTHAAGQRWLELGRLVVLVVGDEPSDIEPLVSGLELSSICVRSFTDGAEALLHCGGCFPDAIVLRARLLDIDSAVWTRAVRTRSAAPIFLGVDEGDVEAAGPALVAGATTLVSRPYSPDQVLAKLTQFRDLIAATRSSDGTLRHGPFEVNLQTFSARYRGRELGLPLKELELLSLLLTNTDRVLSAHEIKLMLWGPEPHTASASVVKTHVRRLRAHIGDPTAVRTVRGQGYILGYLDPSEKWSTPAG